MKNIQKIIASLIIIQGLAMGATLEKLEKENIDFIYEEDRNLPIIFMSLKFKNAGSMMGDKGGLVNLTSRLLNEGTSKEGSVGFATKLENRAISLSSGIGTETFVIDLDSMKSEFPQGITLLKELLKDPNYTKNTLEKIKTQVKGQITSLESNFDYLSRIELNKQLYPNSPLSRVTLGTKEEVDKLSLEDIKKYVHQNLGKDNLYVVIGGDLSKEEAKRYVQEVVGVMNPSKPSTFDFHAPSSEAKVKKHYRDTEQAYISFGSPLHIQANTDKIYLVNLASYILGEGGFGSRLMEEVRVKKGLAYSVYGSLNVTKSSSSFSGSLQTKNSSGDEAIEIVRKVVKDFVQKGVTQEELDLAKQFLVGSQPLKNERLSSRLSRAGNEYYNNRPLGEWKTQLQKTQEVSLEELNSFIQSHAEIEDISFSVVTKKE